MASLPPVTVGSSNGTLSYPGRAGKDRLVAVDAHFPLSRIGSSWVQEVIVVTCGLRTHLVRGFEHALSPRKRHPVTWFSMIPARRPPHHSDDGWTEG